MSEVWAIILTKPRPTPDAWLQWVVPGELPDYEQADGREVVLREVPTHNRHRPVYEIVEGDDE